MAAVHLERNGAIAGIILDRPAVRNAFDDQLVRELAEAFAQAGEDDQVRCIVLSARGKAFCAGADLSWMKRMAGYSMEENIRDAAALSDMLHRIHTCPKPVVCRVHGDAYAGALGLIAASDIAVGLRSASFCFSEVKLGLIPATIGPYALKAVGVRALQRYFLTAEVFDADRAHAMGLLHDVAETVEALDALVGSISSALAAAAPAAAASCKQFLLDAWQRPLGDDFRAETVRLIAALRGSKEAQDRMRAFLEKSRPRAE